MESVSVNVNSGASVSSSWSWSGSGSRTLTVSATVSNRLGPVSVTYAVVVRQHQEQTLSRQVNYQDYRYCHYSWDYSDPYNEPYPRPVYGRVSQCGCCDTLCCVTEYYQGRVDMGTTSMSATANLLLLPTGVTVHTQPSSSVTAASTTNIAVTLQLVPAVTVTNGHPFTAEKTSVSESGTAARRRTALSLEVHDSLRCIDWQRSRGSKCSSLSLHFVADIAYSHTLSDAPFGSNAQVTLTVGIVKDAGPGFAITFAAKNGGTTMFSVTTNTFTINVASITATTQPASVYQYASGSSTVSPSITVSLRSSDGDNLDNASPSVSATLSETSGSLVTGSVASSSQSTTAAAGVASFTYVMSLESGDSYRISVLSTTASVNSNIFVINPFQLVIATQPSSMLQYPNSATSVSTGNVVVHLKDGSGNTLTGSSTDSRSMSVTLQEVSGATNDMISTHFICVFHIFIQR